MPRFDPKRPIDILLSALGLVVLAPVMAAVAAAVAVALGRPVFFRQLRPGLHGKPFRLVKFRTMLDAVDSEGKPLDDARRLTRFGRLLRASSLDELPELWNILRGDMSLVGPRPLLMRYLPLYSPEQARRHDVRPGLTGWSQVNGRNALSWPEKLALDTWYVDHRSFRLDLRILLMTVAKVFSRAGIAGEGSETMTEFRGNDEAQGDIARTRG
jgi:lipopolysaccharide/colanic/teichoic acid biosynthesis glycosyltransferase